MGKKRQTDTSSKANFFCYYCGIKSKDEEALISHQASKHFACPYCTPGAFGRLCRSVGGLVSHVKRSHKKDLDKVPGALEGRDSIDVQVFGMNGIPEDILDEEWAKWAAEAAKEAEDLLAADQAKKAEAKKASIEAKAAKNMAEVTPEAEAAATATLAKLLPGFSFAGPSPPEEAPPPPEEPPAPPPAPCDEPAPLPPDEPAPVPTQVLEPAPPDPQSSAIQQGRVEEPVLCTGWGRRLPTQDDPEAPKGIAQERGNHDAGKNALISPAPGCAPDQAIALEPKPKKAKLWTLRPELAPFKPGCRVRIKGLTNRTALNGLQGIVTPRKAKWPGTIEVRAETGQEYNVRPLNLDILQDDKAASGPGFGPYLNLPLLGINHSNPALTQPPSGFAQTAPSFIQQPSNGFNQSLPNGFVQPTAGFSPPTVNGFAQPNPSFSQPTSGFLPPNSNGFGQPTHGFNQPNPGYSPGASTGFGQPAHGLSQPNPSLGSQPNVAPSQTSETKNAAVAFVEAAMRAAEAKRRAQAQAQVQISGN